MSLTARFFDLPAELMTALGTVLGFALTGGLTYAQQNSLGNWLELIGQILDTNASQGQLLQANDTSRRLDAMERELIENAAHSIGSGEDAGAEELADRLVRLAMEQEEEK